MKLESPSNPNYAATVIRVKSLVKLSNSDNLQGIPVFGLQAIVDMQTQVGDIGVLFPCEVQLSDEYCRENNLFRHAEQNKEPDKRGYLEDNRRVRAIKLRGNRSDALFLPLDSLSYCVNPNDLREGDVFDALNGHELCKKYEVVVRSHGVNNKQQRIQSRVDGRFMPEQFDIRHFLREIDSIDPQAECIVTQKLHGCNIRVANTLVARRLSLIERIAKRFGIKVQEQEYDKVYGSHHVIKDAENPLHKHFYDYDVWTEAGSKIADAIPQGYVLYGELVGWTRDGKPIQKNYTYDQPVCTNKIYVYRVTHINPQGIQCDLSWEQVKEFCRSIGVAYTPEIARTHVDYLALQQPNLLDEYMDVNYHELWQKTNGLIAEEPVKLAPESPCDEGVCIRVEGMQPRIWKVKSPMFLGHETKMLDAGEVELEAVT